MEERLKQFGLELAPEKTQCIEFGAFAIKRAKVRGEKAATFKIAAKEFRRPE